MAEQLAVNQQVAGSSPAGSADTGSQVVSYFDFITQWVECLTRNQNVLGSIPNEIINKAHYNLLSFYGDITQLEECLAYIQKVTGSSPVVPTKKNKTDSQGLGLLLEFFAQW